jgi:hemolysin activation/secretion protein
MKNKPSLRKAKVTNFRLHALAALVVSLGLGMSAVQAQTFAVQRYEVTGDNPLSADETQSVLAGFVGADMSLDRLQQATVALETRLRERGFSLHRVSLPSQAMGAVVQLAIVRFAVGKISFSPAGDFDEANLRNSVPELQAGQTPNFREMARQLGIANENPAKQTTVSLRESEEPNKIDAEVKAAVEKPWTLNLGLTNSGTASTGRDRLTASLQHANLFNRDHVGTLAYTTTSSNPSNVQQWGATYRLPLYSLGGVLSATATKSNVLGGFGGFSVSGAGETAGVTYTHHFQPDVQRRITASVGYDVKRFDPALFNGVPITLLGLKQEVRPLTLGATLRDEFAGFAYGVNWDVAFNTSGGSGNTLAAYQDTDPRVRTTKFVVFHGGASAAFLTANKIALVGRLQYQISRNVLIPGEQFGLGGAGSVRGMPDRVISGDSGALISLEATSPELTQGLRLVGFFDAGSLSNRVTSATKPGSDSVASIGIGLRWTFSKALTVSLDWAQVVDGSSVATAVGAQKNDSKAHLNVNFRY